MTTSTRLRTPSRDRLFARACFSAVAAVALVGVCTGSASAQPGLTDDGSTEATVEVSSAINLSGLTPDFTLSGIPGATVASVSVVEFTVETNNLAGYAVTVQSETATLIAATPGNTDAIPIGALAVRETGGIGYTALSSTASVPVHTQAVRSAEGGDDLANDYRVIIPFVNEDSYVATLDYVATTL